jgi:hypothetical protein
MKDLKPETVARFKELYTDFPELIDYRIKCGNAYQMAQATLIRSVAVGDLQAPDCLAALSTCKKLPNTNLEDKPR